MKIEKNFLTVKEAAEYLGMTQQGVWKMCHEKRIRYYKPNGKRIYIALDDVELYITSGEISESRNESNIENKQC